MGIDGSSAVQYPSSLLLGAEFVKTTGAVDRPGQPLTSRGDVWTNHEVLAHSRAEVTQYLTSAWYIHKTFILSLCVLNSYFSWEFVEEKGFYQNFILLRMPYARLLG